ncbi:S8 family serine peptidase [Bacillus inaquosorum]|uniref:S8 family peptidase n=1 Tax=Bacillus inaquosorum TaxID=483913 RepID=UPI00227DA34F|nr:S8 family serine peptidase [Bacillus inaquosorum]MCY8723629.1 S8 family serine peptidase [Bacillus inaquosorum]MCY8787934.1 S8 family serine peptidase [Bacillus inaquosorum]MCY9010601.1 S8 family serine peptidase [Bacillus inaquosorum]MCY9034066.1 S8 family serine peptidase [Bacillus inaquosorum]MCY9036851.1 S8 family serine peptidase [Bacillus inaquosorum]
MLITLINYDEKSDNSKIKVAILDSGISQDNKELNKLIVKEYNAIKPHEKLADEFNHGTAVAGIIALNVDSNIGNHAKMDIYSVKVLDKDGYGNVKALTKAINWCIKEKVKIINISAGVQYGTDDLYHAVQKAVNNGIIIISAAGNNYGLSVDYPAKYKGVISINTIDQNHKVPDFSADGKIDYAMPGVNLKSINNNNKISYFTGTSFSTAYATRVVATIIANQQGVTNYYNIKQKLSPFTTKLGTQESKIGQGYLKKIN